MTSPNVIEFKTRGDGDIIDLTAKVRSIVEKSDINEGIVTVCAIGSTAAITTIEYEPGLQQDMPALMQKLIPSDVTYAHDATWGDGNGYAHLRSALIGTDFTTAVANAAPVLGTWQQIVFLEFDNRARDRRVFVQVMGE
jgi:secondary thiamine-phosphate synthase enzyme